MEWSEDETEITFAKIKTFHFEPELTKVDLNATINSVNIIASSIIDKISYYGYLRKLVSESVVNNKFKKFNTSMFITATIDQMLFAGYDISVLPEVNDEASKKYPDNLYGLMHNVCYRNVHQFLVNMFDEDAKLCSFVFRKISHMTVFGP